MTTDSWKFSELCIVTSAIWCTMQAPMFHDMFCFLYFQTTVHCDICFTYRAQGFMRHDVCCAIHCVLISSIFTTHHLSLDTNLMGFCLAKEARVDILVYLWLAWAFSLRLVLKAISFHDTIFVREYCLTVVLSPPLPHPQSTLYRLFILFSLKKIVFRCYFVWMLAVSAGKYFLLDL